MYEQASVEAYNVPVASSDYNSLRQQNFLSTSK